AVICLSGSGAGTIAVESMCEENARADQSQYRCHCLNHFQTSLPSAYDKTTAALHSQKDSKGRRRDGGVVRFCRNTLSGSGTAKPVFQRESVQPLIHHATAVPISAAFALRYRHYPMRRWAASGVAARGSKSSKQPGGMVV